MAEIPVEELIRKAAVDRGVDPAVALRIAERESSLNPTAKNKLSSAYGLFQITDKTWKQYGGTKENRASMEDNIRIGMDIIADNERTYVKKFGRAPSPAELYSMHFLGRTGGPKVLSADPAAPLASVVSPNVIKQNPNLKGKTVGEFIASMQRKMGAVGDMALARRSVKEQRAGTVPMPQAPKETIQDRGPRERLQPLAMSPSMMNELGPNYQAALAAMALADTREDDDDEDSLASQYREQQAAKQSDDIFEMPQRFAGLELSYQSPFPEEQQPVMMAEGGEVKKDAEATAREMYAQLKRTDDAIDQEGLKYWTGRVQSNEKSLEDLKKEFMAAADTADDPYFEVNRLYQRINQTPDTEGFNYWVNRAKQEKLTPQQLGAQFIGGLPAITAAQQRPGFGAGGQYGTYNGLPMLYAPEVDKVLSGRERVAGDVVNLDNAIGWDPASISGEISRGAASTGVYRTPVGMSGRQQYVGDLAGTAKRYGIDPAQYTTTSSNQYGMQSTVLNEDALYNALDEKMKDYYAVQGYVPPAGTANSAFTRSDIGGDHARVMYQRVGDRLVPMEESLQYSNMQRAPNYSWTDYLAPAAILAAPFALPYLAPYFTASGMAKGAAVGAGSSLAQGKDPFKGAIQGAATSFLPSPFAKGGEVIADPFGVPDSGPVTADTRKALTTGQGFSAAEMMRMLRKVGGEGASNLESLARGSVSAVPGVVGDIESFFRDDKNRRFATTKEVERQYLPKRLTAPTKESEGFTEAGTFIDPTIALKAAKPVAKGAVAAGKALAPTAAEMMMRMAPAAKPMYMAEEAAGGVSPVGFTSRLEDFISQQKGPVTKQQFLGTLRGKFRDYDIARVEKALSDFEGQKLKPDVILDRLETTFPVKTLQRNLFEPTMLPNQRELRPDYDNVYRGQPMGILTLNLPTSEAMIAAKNRSDALQEGLMRLRAGQISKNPQLMDILDEFAYETGGVQARHQLQKAMDAGIKLENIYTTADKYEKIYSNPSGVNRDLWTKTFQKEMERRGLDPAKTLDAKTTRELINLSNEAVWKKADVELERMNIVPPERIPIGKNIASGIDEERFKVGVSQVARQFNTQAKYQQSELLQNISPAFQQKLDNFSLQNQLYRGAHPDITQKVNQPVALSRFTDHVVDIPDIGKTKVMYVNELQSDLFNDIWRVGSKSGNKYMDLQNSKKIYNEGLSLAMKKGGEDEGVALFRDLVKYKKDARFETAREKAAALEKIKQAYGDEMAPLIKELLPIADKHVKLETRAAEGTYNMPEAFANMENSPQVVQQLMIKNVIGAAIDRGVNAVAFPGAESFQPQLYEKLQGNLKQVVKDLGPGFDIRQITLTNKAGENFSHWGLVWGKEAADRLKSKGIPFKKGGLVEKSDYDNRKYI